jgi:hypothetical protein
MWRIETMKVMLALCAAATVALVGTARAAELKSGLQAGEGIGAFQVEKCGGAADDGVEAGKKLCYRCKLGARPMVMVFTRKTDEKLAKLVEQLDKTVQANSDAKLAAFVNVISDDVDKAKTAVKDFEKKHKSGSVALVVPLDQPNGPDNYKLSKDADVTVIIAKEGKVSANHALKADGLNEEAIKKIVADAKKLVE